MGTFDPNSKLVKLQNVGEQAVLNKVSEHQKPKVISDVIPPEIEKQTLPSEESIRIEQKLIQLREDMQAAMKDFNGLFKRSVLPENRTQEEKQVESQIFNELINRATQLNSLSTDEGTISLNILALRHLLSLRDAGNKLAYQTYLLEKSEFGEATEDKKRRDELIRKQEKLRKMQEDVDAELKKMEE